MKRYLIWALVSWLAWWAINDPASAAHLVHGITGLFSRAAAALSQITSGS